MMSDILIGKDSEKIIIDKIRECFNISKYFSLIILNDNDTPNSEINDFLERNDKDLLGFSTIITNEASEVRETWFLVGTDNYKIQWRYRYEGDIISGLQYYIDILKHIKQRDGT